MPQLSSNQISKKKFYSQVYFVKIKKKGCASNCLKDVLYMSHKAHEFGYEAVLVLPPYYYKNGISDVGLAKFYTTIADELSGKIPVVLYNMPSNTNINLSVNLVKELSKHENIIGIKDSTGNSVQMGQYVRNSSNFSVLTGSGSTLCASLSVGASGGINALANVFPEETCLIYEEFKNGNFEKSFKLQSYLTDINQCITAELGVSALKIAMEENGFGSMGDVCKIFEINFKYCRYFHYPINKSKK
jgi:4-hydroxy-2-oxoglutarate aldolase